MKTYRLMTALLILASSASAFALTPVNPVWGVDGQNQVYRWSFANKQFEKMPGTLKQVSIGSDGEVWGVDPNDNVYRWDGTQWQALQGRLRQISVRSAQEVWGVNAADDVFRWNGTAWESIPSKLKQVSVASDGTVWGINVYDDLYRRVGNNWQPISYPQSNKLRLVSVTNARSALGVDQGDHLSRWTDGKWDWFGARTLDAAEAPNGDFWTVVETGSMYFSNDQGKSYDRMMPMNIALKQIAVGASPDNTPPPPVSNSGMTTAQEQAVLQAHNTERATYPGVSPLRWSPELAVLARDWAQKQVGQTRPQHRPSAEATAQNPIAPGQYLGENMAWGWPPEYPSSDYIGNWINEKIYYHYDRDDGFGYRQPPGCDQGQVCGHFTQVIWKNTQFVGCGLAVTGAAPGSQQTMLVCNYYPAGNISGQKPY